MSGIGFFKNACKFTSWPLRPKAYLFFVNYQEEGGDTRQVTIIIALKKY